MKISRRKYACSFCRSKKIKCDRNAPCLNCVKYNQSCSLGVTNRSSNLPSISSAVSERMICPRSNGVKKLAYKNSLGIEMNEAVGIGLKELESVSFCEIPISNSSYIDLFEFRNAVYGSNVSMRRIYGPLSCSTLLSMDALMMMAINFKKGEKVGIKSVFDHSDVYKEEKIKFEEANFKSVSSTNEVNISCASKSQGLERTCRNAAACNYRILAENSNDSEKIKTPVGLLDSIVAILPDTEAIMMSIDGFFQNSYYLFPILDEVAFRIDLEKIMMDSAVDKNYLKIKANDDYIILGTLLMIIKISSFTHVTKINNLQDSGRSGLSSSEGSEMASLAEKCLRKLNYFQSTDLRVLQLLLLIAFNTMYSPEGTYGLEEVDLRGLSSTIINMAYSMGLNSEPRFDNVNAPDIKKKILYKKVWYHAVLFDIYCSMSYGEPLKSALMHSENSIDITSNESEVLLKLEPDEWIVFQTMKKNQPLLEIIIITVGELFNHGRRVNMSKFLEVAGVFESSIFESFSTKSDRAFSSYSLSFEDIITLNISLKSISFLHSLYLRIYLGLDSEDVLSEKMNFKLLKILMDDSLPLCLHILDYYLTLPKKDHLFYLVPSVLLMCNSVLIMVQALSLRLRALTILMSKELISLEGEIYCEKLVSILSTLTYICNIVLKYAELFSNRYFLFWRLKKVHQYFQSVVHSECFFFKNENQIRKLKLKFSSNHLEEILNVLKHSYDKIQNLNLLCVHPKSVESNVEPFEKTSDSEIDTFWQDLKIACSPRLQGFDSPGPFNDIPDLWSFLY